ncbi:ATP-grasp domain-containing protein [Streptomyces sp. DSM 44915]|uniref:ATP-grasp domain-containing protein n=1 Tax=Streptomyces chisholmiae TaxID=3075540 RepID=A0ABU2JWS5_9ACTN|nr:ATP-grasp domain-containing protein [Streptomyces sp. DSM 44915]MDT0269463.1 ATP-grasp domain-containing protein [Streptomyces sp. DSM 44915]
MRTMVEPSASPAAGAGGPRLTEPVVLVDAVLNGAPFKRAAADLGRPVIGVYTYDRDTVAAMDPEHRRGDAVSLYGDDPARLAARVRELTDSVAAVVPATEPGVGRAAELAELCGVPGNPAASARACRDKRLMRDLARRAGLRVPAYRVAADAAGVAAAAQAIGFPVIVKPATGAASHHVRLVRDEAELHTLAPVLDSDRRDLFGGRVDQWLVEEYVGGQEFAVNTFTVDGRHTVLDTWEYRLPSAGDYDNPYWDFVQVDGRSPARAEVERFALAVLDAFGVRLGPCHVEVKLDASGPVLIEIGARLPGAGIPVMWQRHSDWRPYHDTLACYLGRRPALADRPPRFDATIGMCFLRNDGPPGVLRSLTGLELARRLPGVDELLVPHRVGDRVPTTRDLGTELAKVRLSAPSGPALAALIGTVRRTLRFEVAEHVSA